MKKKIFFKTGKAHKMCAVIEAIDRKTSRPLRAVFMLSTLLRTDIS